MQIQKKGLTAILALTFTALGLLAATPVIDDVTMVQLPNSHLVEISYKLLNTNAIITLAIETNEVALSDEYVTLVSGDANQVVEPGDGKKIYWQAGKNWPGHQINNARAKLTAWPTNNPPQYCVVDLRKGLPATTFPVYYFISSNGVPEGITSDLYKKTHLLLRRIEATDSYGFLMGSPVGESGRESGDNREERLEVFLNKPFYIGVYQVTQLQWNLIYGGWPSGISAPEYRDMRPVETVSYDTIRGTNWGSKWPGDEGTGDYRVDGTSFLGILRNKTKDLLFDLPTEAQWEYACRADTKTAWNNGVDSAIVNSRDSNLAILGRYKLNGGYGPNGNTAPTRPTCDLTWATAKVGTYIPNAWGLYDMHGNVYEWCLDWRAADWSRSGNVDPVGVEESESVQNPPERIQRGGSWHAAPAAERCRSAHRNSQKAAEANAAVGMRLVMNFACE